MGRPKDVFSPLTVSKVAKMYMDNGLIKMEPVWYQPVINIPPMTDFSRKPARTEHPRPWNRPNDIREMQQMNKGMDNTIRTRFYKEHPWELARPKIVVEEDGADYVRQDWSRMEQVGKPLDGESVVRRTLYLMKETKAPTVRYHEIHGFDESQARGRPQGKFPQFGNIQEVNEDVEKIIETWREITTELDKNLHRRKARKDEVAKIKENTTPLTDQQKETLTTLRQEIKYIDILIHRLQKKVRKMTRLSPQRAYLQACSEFYLLRQQEEVEQRIANEQARAFGLTMLPSVNEREIQKEQAVLSEWRGQAQKVQALQFRETTGQVLQKTEEEQMKEDLSPEPKKDEVDELEEDIIEGIQATSEEE